MVVEAVCKVPISYRIGSIDERFDITHDEARLAAADAESVWEEATGRNLFTYDEAGELPINFVFDERQAFADAEIDFRERLDETQGTNSELEETYASLVARYNTLEAEYENKATRYEERLAAYNTKVAEYNEQGGAPKDVYKKLQAEQSMLDSEVRTVNALGNQLNNLAADINKLSEQGNELIEAYNENVDAYNETFGESHEFTQGDYQGTEINIYKFVDTTELKLVLAHEFGHALSLNHVESDTSIMYHHLGAQPDTPVLTSFDLAEFERVCGEHRVNTALMDLLNDLLASLKKLGA